MLADKNDRSSAKSSAELRVPFPVDSSQTACHFESSGDVGEGAVGLAGQNMDEHPVKDIFGNGQG